MATVLDLVAIRSALLAPFAAAATGLGADVVAYHGHPQGKPWPAGGNVVRVVMGLPARAVAGVAVSRVVEQNGTLTLQWMFHRSTGMATVMDAVEGTAALYRAQTLDGGVIVSGDAQTVRAGTEGDRTRWDVIIPWRTVETEAASGDESPLLGELTTTAAAISTVRNLWYSRIDQAVADDGWDGLRTFYDDEPTWATPPALPFAGYWLGSLVSGSVECQSGTEQVLGRANVQVHTDKSLGSDGALAICDRICTQHNRRQHGVSFAPVETVGQAVSQAGTLQTNLRVPFSFERLRPT